MEEGGLKKGIEEEKGCIWEKCEESFGRRGNVRVKFGGQKIGKKWRWGKKEIKMQIHVEAGLEGAWNMGFVDAEYEAV